VAATPAPVSPRKSALTSAPTLKDVAAQVGVSINTVSRCLRAPHTVRPELRRRIEAVLDEVSYVPNRLAGGLSGAHTGVIGVIVTSLYHSEFAAIIEAMQSRLAAAGLQLMIGNSRYDPEEELRLVRSMLSWRPAALALVGTEHLPRARQLLVRTGMPVVEIWDCTDKLIDSGVGMNHRAIGAMQAEHLLAQGCQRLAFVGAVREHDQRARKRLEGARAAVRKRRRRALIVATEPRAGDADVGERLLRTVLAREPAVDGIVCNSDVIAHGVLRGLRHAGRRVPQDVAVVGFGDNASNTCFEPELTSVAPPRTAIGQRAAEQILRRIDGAPRERELIAPELIARTSSRREPVR
jgi:LacI family gluconate utilization system Gnt-I transcriptional repressor